MRTTLTIILISFAVSLSVSGQTVTTLGNKCVAYWDMETAASTEPSRVGSHNATVSGATSTASGANGKGYTFDGTNDVMDIAAIALGNNMAISMWVKASGTGLSYRHAIGRNYGNAGISIGSTSKFYGQLNGTGQQAGTNHDANWHHIVVVKNASTNYVLLYIDGTYIGQQANTDNEEYAAIAWQIGAHGNSSQYWSGTIDEVGLFNVVLSSDDVSTLYNTGTCPDFDSWYYTTETPPAYNPIPGRHVWPKARGNYRIPLAKGEPVYFLAKKQAVQTYTQIDLAQDRTYILSGDAQDYDWVGELQASRSWRADEGGTVYYTYNINEDTSGLFGISSNVIYCKDVSRMQSSKRYAITYAVYDGYYYDVANLYIYKPPTDSCITVNNWLTYDGNFTTGYYYFQARGTELPITQKIDINVNDVYIGAIGVGNKPVLNKSWQNDGANNYMHGLFHSLSKSGITIQSMYFDPNGYGSSNPYYSCAIFMNGCSNVKIDNCDLIGDMAGDLMDLWGYVARLEATLNVTYTNNNISGVLYDGLYLTGSTGGLIENNRVTFVNNVVRMPTWTYSVFGGGDIFFLRTTTSGGSFNIRHNYGDKSNQTCKSMIVLKRPGTSLAGSDTIEFNYFKGYSHTGEIAYTYQGVTGFNFSGVSGSVIRYNVFEDLSRVFYTYPETVNIGGTNYYCNGSANNKFYYNLCINSYILPITLTDASTGTQIYNNTFAGFGTAWFDGYEAVKGFYHGVYNTNIVNNIIYQTGYGTLINPYYSNPTGTVDYNLYSHRVSHTLNAHEIQDDPEFNTDFTLKSISPAINAGTTTISGGLGIDLKKVTIPKDALYDIGCYEGAYDY